MRIIAALVIGQLVGLLGWFDPLFIPLILVGPPVTGAIAASRRIPLVLVVLTWASAGGNMIWTDYLVNHEDVAFHVVVSIIVSVLAALGYGVVALARRITQRRGPTVGQASTLGSRD